MKLIKQSSNLAFVAALVSYGAEVIRTDKSIPSRTKFFIDTEGIKQVFVLTSEGKVETRTEELDFDSMLNLFVSDRLLLLPNYMSKITDLKSLIYA